MASISSSGDIVSITCGLNTHILRLCNHELFTIAHPKVHEDNSLGNNLAGPVSSEIKSHVDSDDVGLGMLCSDISPCGSLLTFCTYTKHLCIVNLKEQKPILSRVYRLARGASKIKFTKKSNNIVVADKSGDVYIYNIASENSDGKLILGHLSLLLDLLITPDEQFIITCDRDEKIRVSNFPNCYNIVSYCLGHSEFVSSINLLPHNDMYLVSTSGDCTVRFWDYKIGKEHLVCNTLMYLESHEVDNSVKEEGSAISDTTVTLIDSTSSLVCVCIENFKLCLVLKCTSVCGILKCSLLQNITFKELIPWRITVSSNLIWFILNCNDSISFSVKKFNSSNSCFEDEQSECAVKALDILNKQQLIVDSKKNIVNLLFKRRFDNVEEYLRKKDSRLTMIEPSIKKSKK